MERRDFFTKGLPSYMFKLGKTFIDTAGINEVEKKEYFDSFETCYPYLSEVSYEMLVQAAQQLGIEVGDKDKLTLAKEVFEKEGRVPRE